METFALKIPKLFGVVRALLLAPKRSLGEYILTVALISSGPIGIATILAQIFGYRDIDVDGIVRAWPIDGHPEIALVISLLDVILFSPFIETALMFVPIWFFRKLRIRQSLLPFTSALVWGFIHSRGTAWIQMAQVWPFLCFTIILIGHEKPSVDRAWLITSLVHSAHNVYGLCLSHVLALVYGC